MMIIQDIALSHNQKKKLQKSINDENIIFKDDNGDLVVNVEAYSQLKQDTDTAPIEAILGDDVLDLTSQYLVFS
jgi:hypothetical protein